MATLLYVCSVIDHTTRKPKTDQSKIGITSQVPWERLRKLQIGNIDPLRFEALWIGSHDSASRCESKIKDGRSEWKRISPDEMIYMIEGDISLRKLDLHRVNLFKSIPYTAKNDRDCRFKVDLQDLLFAASIAKGKEFTVARDCNSRLSVEVVVRTGERLNQYNLETIYEDE